jgi:hypothetical protein
MGTSLTGLTPATTYDALIKIGDNGPLSATGKFLSDGLGNDSALALSTSKVGVGFTNPVATFGVSDGTNALYISHDANGPYISGVNNAFTIYKQITYDAVTHAFATNSTEKMRITAAGNVGIGTSTPFQKLSLGTPNFSVTEVQSYNTTDQFCFNFGYVPSGAFPRMNDIIACGNSDGTNGASNIRFFTNPVSSANANEKMRITGDGYLRLSTNSGGIQFNGDTAAANALDDYEEGTWTPTFNAAVTISGSPTGKYTKVGRSVYATCSFTYTALTGADIAVSSLPFTNAAVRQATAVAFAGVARATNQFFGTLVEASGTTFYIEVVNSASGVTLTAHASCWYQV